VKLNIANPTTYQLYTAIAISVLSWSFGPICVRYAFEYNMPPDLIATLRMVIGWFIFTPFVWSRYKHNIRNLSRLNLLLALSAGAMFGLNLIAMTTSLQHISILINQVLVGTIPVWAAMLEVSVLKSPLSRMVWVGILIAFVGGIIIALATSGEASIIEGGNPTLGVILALIGAVGASVYLTIGRKVRSSVSFVPYIWLVYTGGSVVTLIVIGINRIPLTGYDVRGYFWVIMLTLVAQIIGHGVLNYVLKYMPPTTLSVTGQSVPILSAIWAFFLFTEIPTVLQIIGGIIILFGVIIVIINQNKLIKTTD
jgi:drug/metabolite transporter (DMT)-like permease